MLEASQIETMIADVDTRFNATKVREGQLKNELDEVSLELGRQQGEYRVLQQLMQSQQITDEGFTPVEDDGAPESEAHITQDIELRQPILHPVDDSGIPAEGQVVKGNKHGR